MKSIFIFTPSFGLHGGIRVILEWANRLAERHQVFLRPLHGHSCDWFKISPKVRIVFDDIPLTFCDLVIITSPHSIKYDRDPLPKRKVVFLQMMEHQFQPNNKVWRNRCLQTYQSDLPLITISRWGIDKLYKEFHRAAPTHYVGNGVNLDHFPISYKPKDGKTVLVEGWMAGNSTKDNMRIGPQVAQQLRARGYRIIAYSAVPASGSYKSVPHEYHAHPSLSLLNELYERASILIKATHCDFRSTSPMEAMTKGTVTARAIDEGDDDLIHDVNCLRGKYNQKELLKNALDLLTNTEKREKMSRACLEYVQAHSWDYWMEKIERILWT